MSNTFFYFLLISYRYHVDFIIVLCVLQIYYKVITALCSWQWQLREQIQSDQVVALCKRLQSRMQMS